MQPGSQASHLSCQNVHFVWQIAWKTQWKDLQGILRTHLRIRWIQYVPSCQLSIRHQLRLILKTVRYQEDPDGKNFMNSINTKLKIRNQRSQKKMRNELLLLNYIPEVLHQQKMWLTVARNGRLKRRLKSDSLKVPHQ